MTTKNRNLTVAAGAVVAAALVLWNLIPGPTSTGTTPSASPSAAATHTPMSSATPSPGETTPSAPPATSQESGVRSYSIALHELSGLTASTPAGTHIEIWAAWDAGSERPQVQRLLKDVVIERIEPPFLPEGPTEVILSIDPHEARRMFWGDKYANLGAVIIR